MTEHCWLLTLQYVKVKGVDSQSAPHVYKEKITKKQNKMWHRDTGTCYISYDSLQFP